LKKKNLVKYNCNKDFTASEEESQGGICVAREAKGSALRKRQRKQETIELT